MLSCTRIRSEAGGIEIGNATTSSMNDTGIAIGNGSTSNGSDSVVMGNSSVGNTTCVVIGSNAMADGRGTVNIGSNSTSDRTIDSVVIGESSFSDSNLSVAIGKNSSVEGDSGGSISIGYDSKVGSLSPFISASDCISIGNGATCNNPSSIAIGLNATQSVAGLSIAIGTGASTIQAHAVAIGTGASSDGFSISMGSFASALNVRGVTLGAYSSVNNNYGISLGFRASSSLNSIAIGSDFSTGTLASGNNSISIGRLSSSTTQNTIAIGYNTTASFSESVAIGHGISNTYGGVLLGTNSTKLVRFDVPGTVSQTTNNNTTVSTNQPQGRIIMQSAIAANTSHTFTVNNNKIKDTSVVICTVSGTTSAGVAIPVSTTVGSGSFNIHITNPDTVNATTASPIVHFHILFPNI